MARASERLLKKLQKLAAAPGRPGRRPPGGTDVPGVEELIGQGLDPVHAAYASVQQITSVFAEGVSRLPEMKAYTGVVAAAEDEYLPDGPPVSPLTRSFFTTWAFYDRRSQEAGFDSHLIKPADLTALQELLAAFETAGRKGARP
jgi:hypothetical protein